MDGSCQKKGEAAEICWDGIDNDGDGVTDCADNGCFSDSFCGFVSGGSEDCFSWGTPDACEAVQLSNGLNCTWVTDAYGGWCDFPGSDCWKRDGTNETHCTDKDGCGWSSGSGGGWCEQDWESGNDCYSAMSESACGVVENCTWTNDTWCDANPTDQWCIDQGGWCDPDAFAPKNCWQGDNTDSDTCEAIDDVCYYDGTDGDGWCMEQGCWNYDGNQSGCDDQANCFWELPDWQSCETNWNLDCWKYNETSCGTGNDCSWNSNYNYCGHPMDVCWNLNTENECGGNDNCYWDEYSWNPSTATDGECRPVCNTLSESECNLNDLCQMNEGWCMTDMGTGNSDVGCWNYEDSGSCDGVDGCKWKNDGWCDPAGFGGAAVSGSAGSSGESGSECWKYDGNQSACTNSSLIGINCSWFTEPWPFCEPNWGSSECWEYSNRTDCNGDGNCWWDGEGEDDGWCTNINEQCHMNDTLADNGTLCNANENLVIYTLLLFRQRIKNVPR